MERQRIERDGMKTGECESKAVRMRTSGKIVC